MDQIIHKYNNKAIQPIQFLTILLLQIFYLVNLKILKVNNNHKEFQVNHNSQVYLAIPHNPLQYLDSLNNNKLFHQDSNNKLQQEDSNNKIHYQDNHNNKQHNQDRLNKLICLDKLNNNNLQYKGNKQHQHNQLLNNSLLNLKTTH